MEKKAKDLSFEKNNYKDELCLKLEAYNALNTAMEQLKVDRDKHVKAAKEIAKTNLIKGY